MLQPLSQWICDICDRTIAGPEDGYLIWKNDDTNRAFSFRIVHLKQCDPRDVYPCSMSLDRVLGTDGLTLLLAKLSLGPFLQGSENRGVANIDEYVDLIRRLHTPHYEEARVHFNDDDLRSEMGGFNEFAPYCVDRLQEIIQTYGEHADD